MSRGLGDVYKRQQLNVTHKVLPLDNLCHLSSLTTREYAQLVIRWVKYFMSVLSALPFLQFVNFFLMFLCIELAKKLIWFFPYDGSSSA